jgi:uncharacterized membrane protein YfcA
MLDELNFEILLLVVGCAAGAIAAIAGFGVGSLLTPLLAPLFGAKTAVALVSVPHAIGTIARLWRLKDAVDWHVMKSFGAASAAGGLTGAFVYTQATADDLARVLGILLIVVGAAEMAGVGQRWRLRGGWAWVAGAVSGLFGGMVGNQGGVRSAGLLGFDLTPRAFVATAASIALIVDAVRVPVYLWSEGAEMLSGVRVMAVATIGVMAGTFGGTRLLMRLPKVLFRRAVGVVLLGLGTWMLI